MFSLWFLSAAVLAVLTYCFRRTQRVRKLKHSDTEPSVPELTTGIVGIPEREGEQGRIMRWISIGEFEAVLKECSDLIVIDLRAEAKSTPFPVPVPLVLPVAPNDLFEVLDCLPPDKSVAFCGAFRRGAPSLQI